MFRNDDADKVLLEKKELEDDEMVLLKTCLFDGEGPFSNVFAAHVSHII